MIGDHYLVVQRWRPEFSVGEDTPRRIAVWVRIPRLPIEYYDKHILWRIGNKLGKTIKVDYNTFRQRGLPQEESLITERGKFARICTEVNLQKVLISKFRIHRKLYAVEYEGLHMICFQCGKYGHRMGVCPLANPTTAPEVSSQAKDTSPPVTNSHQENAEQLQTGNFGPWMLVQRNRSKPGANQTKNQQTVQKLRNPKHVESAVNEGKNQSGSRYEIFADLEGMVEDLDDVTAANNDFRAKNQELIVSSGQPSSATVIKTRKANRNSKRKPGKEQAISQVIKVGDPKIINVSVGPAGNRPPNKFDPIDKVAKQCIDKGKAVTKVEPNLGKTWLQRPTSNMHENNSHADTQYATSHQPENMVLTS